jgi:two-component system, cell cycle sensor histidine kinase and response regulator CckA
VSNQIKDVERKEVVTTAARSSTSVGKILVVDDEPELRSVLVESLQKHRYEVTGCGSGRDALAELRERDFDLLLTDLMMPEMDGIALLKAALVIDPHLVGIIVTGQGTIQTAVDAMQIGAFDYVLKPFRMQTLLRVLTRAMNVRHLKLENVELRETVAIHSLCQTVAFTLDPQTVLSKLADAAVQQSDADEVSILLPTSDGTELYVAAVRGEKRERLLGERVPLEESISSWVARERVPLILNGEVRDERFVALWPRPEIRSAISVPMQAANKLVGIINLNVTNRLRPFTLGQMKALSILASTAAAALESASLYAQVLQAEERYRSIFENAIEGVFQSTPEGRFITVNPSMAQILGYESPAEVIATITDIAQQLYVHPEARAKASQIQEERGLLHGFEFEAYRKGGEKIWLSVNRRSIRDENGTEIYREGSIENITERKRVEERQARRSVHALFRADVSAALAMSRAPLRPTLESCVTAMVEHLGAAFARIWTLNRDEEMLELQASAGMYTHLDGPHARVPVGSFKIGKIAQERLPHITNEVQTDPRVSDKEWARREGMIAFAGYPLLVENRTLGVMAMFSRKRLAEDTLDALASVADLISQGIERKRAEEELRESEERYRLLFESSPQPMWVYDLETLAFLAVNESAIHHYGYSREDFLAMTIKDIRPAKDIPALYDSVSKGSEGVDAAGTWRHLKKNGTIIEVEITSHLLVFADRRAELILAHDITKRNRLEAALLASEEQLRQSQKLEAIGQLAGGVAHDFNNLLTAINGYSALALRRVGDDHPISSYLVEITKAGDRAANLTRQLLAFGRKQLLQPLAINLNDIVGDMIKLLKRLIGEDVQLVTKPGANLKQIKVDPGQMEQVLVNLVVNARDAMARGGTVTIETANIKLDGTYASRHVGLTPGEYVMLAISDTGTGMDHDTQSRIFEPFFTTKETGKGTGLGLSTVYGIVKQSGGNVWVYSEPGKGTTFKVYLPQVEGEATARAESKALATMKRGSETVLLVEDEDMVRKLTGELLEENGYSVLEANGGEEAISIFKERKAPIDLLITDVVMPKISGTEVAEQLKKIHPETKVLFMSGYTDEAIVHHGIVDSGIAFIQKPFSENALTRKVRDVLDAEKANR